MLEGEKRPRPDGSPRKDYGTTARIQTGQDVWVMLASIAIVPHAESDCKRLVTEFDDLFAEVSFCRHREIRE